MEIFFDEKSNQKLDVYYATVYSNRKRPRYPVGCVTVMASEEAALAAAENNKKLMVAKVAGPFRSSEGQMMYYLVEALS